MWTVKERNESKSIKRYNRTRQIKVDSDFKEHETESLVLKERTTQPRKTSGKVELVYEHGTGKQNFLCINRRC